jgi:nicotinamidase-related amidase
MNSVISHLRARGVTIIHSPSDTLDFYENSAARRRIAGVERFPLPEPRELADPPLPVDAGDGGCDTDDNPGGVNQRFWTREHPGIYIDEDRDAISDDGTEIYSYLKSQSIETILFIGIHTNMCVLHRSFGIKNLVRWGVDTVFVRDLTDAMYNPARPPYVSHEEGTNLVIEYIEKFWCPTTTGQELLSES